MENCSQKYENLNNNPHWYALLTRSRHERKIDVLLHEKNIESYLPMYWSKRYWSDRIKKIELPLFSCYIFVRIELKDKLKVLQIPGVIKLISFNNIPCPIPDIQIESIRKLLSNDVDFTCEDNLHSGEDVKVVNGPFKGLIGKFQHSRGRSRFYILVEVINQNVGVEIDAADIKVIK